MGLQQYDSIVFRKEGGGVDGGNGGGLGGS